MRGKRHKVWDAYEFDRITPADAGKTKAQYRKEDIVWDHPRGCGENFLFLLI